MTEIITDYLDAKQLADRLTALELRSTSELARLERERDEAREKVEQQRKEIVRLNGATSHAGGTPLKIALRERDEALSQIVQAECRAERFCQERDEAREDLKEETKFHHRTHIELIQTQCKLLDMEMQRDEARDAIVGWENKWKCAVDMAARAELERDELKYSLKIRSINESLRYSKDRNESDTIISKLNFKL